MVECRILETTASRSGGTWGYKKFVFNTIFTRALAFVMYAVLCQTDTLGLFQFSLLSHLTECR